MKIAIAIDKPVDWGWKFVLDVEQRQGLQFEPTARNGLTFLVPKEDFGTPGEALEKAREVRKALPPTGSAAQHPLSLWRGELDPVSLEDAWAATFEENATLNKWGGADELPQDTHPMAGSLSMDRD